MSTLLVDSGYPTLPFFLGDDGIDSNRTVTIISGTSIEGDTSLDKLPAGTILAKSGSSAKYRPYVTGDTAAGILFSAVDPANSDVLAAMYVHGVVRSGSLITNSGSAAATRALAVAQLQDQIQFV